MLILQLFDAFISHNFITSLSCRCNTDHLGNHLCVHNYAAWLGPSCRLQSFLLVFYHWYIVYIYCTCIVGLFCRYKYCCLCFAGCSNEAAHLKFVLAQTSHCVVPFLTFALKFRETIRAGVQADFPMDAGFLLPAATAAAAAGSLIYHFYYLIKNHIGWGFYSWQCSEVFADLLFWKGYTKFTGISYSLQKFNILRA